jgi:hypothetical protein
MGLLALGMTLGSLASCETVDPGPNFVVSPETFNENYFFCVVEPQYLFGKKCGPGEAGDNGNCHFNPSAVSGMALRDHPPVACDGNGRPTNPTEISSGSLARANFTAASLEMSRDYLTAPIYVRPVGANHPRQIFMPNDPIVDVLKEWANRP